MIARDVVAGAAVLALGAGALIEASRLPFGAVRNPGQGFFPWWLGLAMLLLGVVLVAQAVMGRAGPEAAAGRPAKVVALLGALAFYVAAFDLLGYPLATFLLALFMVRVLAQQRWPLALGVSVLAALGSYVLFAVWLGVPLPGGPLGR